MKPPPPPPTAWKSYINATLISLGIEGLEGRAGLGEEGGRGGAKSAPGCGPSSRRPRPRHPGSRGRAGAAPGGGLLGGGTQRAGSRKGVRERGFGVTPGPRAPGGVPRRPRRPLGPQFAAEPNGPRAPPPADTRLGSLSPPRPVSFLSTLPSCHLTPILSSSRLPPPPSFSPAPLLPSLLTRSLPPHPLPCVLMARWQAAPRLFPGESEFAARGDAGAIGVGGE